MFSAHHNKSSHSSSSHSLLGEVAVRSTDGGEVRLRAFAHSREEKKGWFTRRREGAKGCRADERPSNFALVDDEEGGGHGFVTSADNTM